MECYLGNGLVSNWRGFCWDGAILWSQETITGSELALSIVCLSEWGEKSQVVSTWPMEMAAYVLESSRTSRDMLVVNSMNWVGSSIPNWPDRMRAWWQLVTLSTSRRHPLSSWFWSWSWSWSSNPGFLQDGSRPCPWHFPSLALLSALHSAQICLRIFKNNIANENVFKIR